MQRFVKGEWNFQGECGFREVDVIPAEAERSVEDGDIVVGHSETGHHHVFDANSSVWLYSTKDQLVAYLDVKVPAVLKHQRAWNTHEEIEFPPGKYLVRRGRERTPEGWRRVED